MRLYALLKPFFKVILIIVIIAAVLLFVDKKGKKEVKTLKKFALIQYSDTPLSELSEKGILDGLSANGYQQHKDFELKVSNAQGDIATLNLMVDAVVNDSPDLVFVTSTPTLQAVVKKIKNIPVVFTVVADPVLAGAGKTFDDHIANITGISTLGDFAGMIKWVKIILPGAKEIGTLFSPGESNSVKNVNELRKYAELAGLKLITVPVNSSQDIMDAAITLAAKKPDVICQIVDNLTATSAGTIINTAKVQKIPVFGFVSDQSKKGAVLVVSRDYHQAGVDAVRLAKRILDGESPAGIPFEFVSKTDVLINPEAAKLFRIALPEEVYTQKNSIVTK